jgi:uncharacterized membrane protein
MAGGIVGPLLAAVPGLFDMRVITDPKVGRIALNHMILNLLAVAVFALDPYLRIVATPTAPLPIALSVVRIILIVLSSWLGGEMVYLHGVGVDQPLKVSEPKQPQPSNLRRLG